MLVHEKCAEILGCAPAALRYQLNHPINRLKVMKELRGQKVRTTYEDRNGMHKTFFIDGLSKEGADAVMAYGRLPRPFNICVAAHFFARHRVRLLFPYTHCIVEQFANGQEDRHYPLEMLELVDKKPKEQQKQPRPFFYLTSSIDGNASNDDDDDEQDEEGAGRDELSQGW